MPAFNASVRGMRRNSTQKAIKAKADRGETTGNERALVRVGKVNTRILTGQEDLSLWSDDELIRGQRKDKNGRWQGVKPKVVPKAIHDELVRRTLANAKVLFRDNLIDAVQKMVDIMNGADTEPKDALKAAQLIVDRVMGKVPDKIDLVVGEKPRWEAALEDALIVPDDEDFIEANAEEVEDDEDPFGEEDD